MQKKPQEAPSWYCIETSFSFSFGTGYRKLYPVQKILSRGDFVSDSFKIYPKALEALRDVFNFIFGGLYRQLSESSFDV